jgi:hypothetical protein
MKHLWIIITVLILAVSACKLLEGGMSVEPTPEDVTQVPSAVATTVPVSEEEVGTPTESPTQEAAAPATSQAAIPATGLDQAWLGGFNCGVTLLDSDGQWWGFREEGAELSTDHIFDIAIDSSGKAWIADSLGIRVTDGENWAEISTDFSGGAEAIAIDHASEQVWAVDFKRASVFDGMTWTTHKSRNFGDSDHVDQAKDVAIDPQGRAWVVTASSVAMYDGESWQFWEEGAGLSERYFFETVAAGQDGRIWVGHSNGVLVFDGQGWVDLGPQRLSQVKDVNVAPDGRIWAATWAHGAFVYDGQAWSNYTRENSGIISDRVRSVAFDGQGHVWLGTTWGLSVFDGAEWVSYTMSTSGLAGPCIDAIAIGGNGPVLPQPTVPRLGSVIGLIMLGTEPVEGADIVLCSDKPAMIFSGRHPCADYPFFYEATTDAEGLYTIADIPVGEYQATWRIPEGQWMGYIIGGGKIVVHEGVVTEAYTIDATKR